MATLGTLRSTISAKTGLENSGEEQELIDRWINEGIREILLRTHVNVECADLNTAADTWKYILPSGMLAIKEIWREGARAPLTRVGEEEILEYRGVDSNGSDPDLTRYATIGSNMLLIWPTPTAAYSLDVFYVPKPTELSAASDDPSVEGLGRIPSEFHKAIELYALAEAGDYDDDRSSQEGDRYRARFEQYLTQVMVPAIKKKGGTTMPRARIRNRRRLSRANDRYPR